MEERIYCSAIWYKDLINRGGQTTNNIDEGVVILGLRHGDIIRNVKCLTGLRSVTNAEDGVGRYEQGFLTNKNRFVSREEAWNIAEAQKQLNDRYHTVGVLYSEDIY